MSAAAKVRMRADVSYLCMIARPLSENKIPDAVNYILNLGLNNSARRQQAGIAMNAWYKNKDDASPVVEASCSVPRPPESGAIAQAANPPNGLLVAGRARAYSRHDPRTGP
jgi:hypothetical protein